MLCYDVMQHNTTERMMMLSNNTNTSGGGTLDNRISVEWVKQLASDADIM